MLKAANLDGLEDSNLQNDEVIDREKTSSTVIGADNLLRFLDENAFDRICVPTMFNSGAYVQVGYKEMLHFISAYHGDSTGYYVTLSKSFYAETVTLYIDPCDPGEPC